MKNKKIWIKPDQVKDQCSIIHLVQKPQGLWKENAKWLLLNTNTDYTGSWNMFLMNKAKYLPVSVKPIGLAKQQLIRENKNASDKI